MCCGLNAAIYWWKLLLNWTLIVGNSKVAPTLVILKPKSDFFVVLSIHFGFGRNIFLVKFTLSISAHFTAIQTLFDLSMLNACKL